jgi:hypothetical protein
MVIDHHRVCNRVATQGDAQKGSGLLLCCHYLEIINDFEQGALCFHFALGPANYVAAPTGCV